MERLVDYRCAILVDATTSGRLPLGTVRFVSLEELPDPSAGHTFSAHDASLRTAVAVGRAAGARLPAEIGVVTIEAAKVLDFGEHLSPPIAAAIPEAVQLVMNVLESADRRSRVRRAADRSR
jgi:hydrogenase maturation protease